MSDSVQFDWRRVCDICGDEAELRFDGIDCCDRHALQVSALNQGEVFRLQYKLARAKLTGRAYLFGADSPGITHVE